MLFKGITTALITPFSNGKVDQASFLQLLHLQVHKGIRQFVLAGTTGESPTVEEPEVKQMCQWLKAFEKDHQLSLKCILATGSFSTKQTIEKTKRALDWGAHGLLVVTPYYNRPPQKGLILHFEKVAKASSLPLILYNVPSRTAISLSVESIKTLSQIDQIVGIKESTGDMKFLKQIQKVVPKDFTILSGDDMSCAEFFSLGGHGAISAAGNVLAGEILDVFHSDSSKRKKKFKKYKSFLKELFRETNPIGSKQILHEMGVIASPELRLPLTEVKNPALSSAFAKLCEN